MATIDLGVAQEIASRKEQQYGLPSGTLFKMSGIESSNNAGAVSPKGAQGYFQFMPDTAKAYGLKNPADYEESADAAARYMRDNLKKYNGNLDLSLADYNGGPKAAAALAKGKPWAETQGYLEKFHGKGYAPLSSQFTSGASPTSGYNPSASALYTIEKQQEEKYGGFWNNVTNLPGAVAEGWKSTNTVYNYFQTKGTESYDPNFDWRMDENKQFLQGIPEANWGYILQAGSAAEAALRKSKVEENLKIQQELSQMGVAGFTGTVLGGLADLPTLLAFVPGLGGSALLTTSGRIANAVRMGFIAAGSNAALEAATYQNRPLGTSDDIYHAAMMGLALGGVGGALINPARLAASRLAAEQAGLGKVGLREATEFQMKEVQATGMNLTKEGEALYKRTMAKADPVTGQKIADLEESFGQIAKKDRESVIDRVRKEDADVPTFEKSTVRARRDIKGQGDQKVGDIIQRLKSNDDPTLAAFASHIDGKLRNDVRVVTRRENVRSYYDPARNEIHLAKGADDWVAAHEIAHAITANKIRYGLANPATAHGELVKELKAVFEEAKLAAKAEKFQDFKSSYYLQNLDEFVAGVYSGKGEFLDFLAKTKSAEGMPIISKIVDVFRKIMGMEPGDVNLLTRTLGITDRMIDEPLRVKQPMVFNGQKLEVDYLMSPGADEATAMAATQAQLPEIFGWGLGLENRLGGSKAPTGVRALASKLIGTTIGYKDHSVVKVNAWDDTTKWADSWAVQLRKGTYPEFEKFVSENGYKAFEKGKAFEEFGEQVSRYIRGFDGDFPPEVVKAGNHMRKVLDDVREYINNPLKDEGGTKMGLTMQKIVDPETGAENVVGKLESNPSYLPRKHDVVKWNRMVADYGREAVEGWWARAYKAARPEVSDDAAARFSKWYVTTVEEAHANRSMDMLTDMLRGVDKDALVRSLERNGGFSHFDALKMVEDMFPTKASDTGAVQSSLKHRNSIDEKYTETWTKKDGSQVEVSIHDFIHSNAFDVVEPYLRRTAGNVALAKHLDVYKTSDIDRMIMDATKNELGDDFKLGSKIKGYRDDLKFTFDRIQGLPQEEFSDLRKGLEMWRAFNVIRLMGGTVWNQMIEFSQMIGSMGWKSVTAAVPQLGKLARDAETGKLANEILDHIENVTGGAGADYLKRIDYKSMDDWVTQKGDTKLARGLDKLDTAFRKGAQGVLDYTGMTPLMVQQKRIHTIAMVNHFVDVANGVKDRGFLTKERLAWMGLDDANTERLLKNLQMYSSKKDGKLSVDWDGWIKSDPESHSQFMTAINRESRRIVQENDLPAMIPLMGTTLGQTVFQFMNFTMQAWNKSLMFALNHRDITTFSTVMHGAFFASLAYISRTALSAQGMDSERKAKYLSERLSAKQIAANSFGRISQASLLPNIYDTISPYPMFNGMRTTSDLSSLASNPTYQAVNGLISMKKLIRNGLSDEYQTTEKDIRAWGKLLPLNNVVPISTILNSVANDFPQSEQE